MVKHFNVIMAAVISGTVAFFTSFLGISGTVIGSVLSTFLYQLLSGYSEERYEERGLNKPRLAGEIVYIFPLVVIGILELIFICSALHYKFDMLFDILESAVSNNLFRIMGIGLIILGAYPFYNSNDIDKRNGLVILVTGVLLLLRGLMDISEITSKVFYMFFAPFDMIFALFVVIIIAVVILNILVGSGAGVFKSNDFINSHRPKKPHARKIDTSFNKNNNKYNNPNGFGDLNGFKSNSNESKSNLDESNSNESNLNSSKSNESESEDANQEQLPLYDEEIILVNNPEDPKNPIKKRILKRIIRNKDEANDDFQDVYIVDELE